MAKKNLKGIATNAFNSVDAFKSMIGQEEKKPTNKANKDKSMDQVDPDWNLLKDYGIKEPKSKNMHLLIRPSTYKKLQEQAKAENISVNELINQKLERD